MAVRCTNVVAHPVRMDCTYYVLHLRTFLLSQAGHLWIRREKASGLAWRPQQSRASQKPFVLIIARRRRKTEPAEEDSIGLFMVLTFLNVTLDVGIVFIPGAVSNGNQPSKSAWATSCEGREKTHFHGQVHGNVPPVGAVPALIAAEDRHRPGETFQHCVARRRREWGEKTPWVAQCHV